MSIITTAARKFEKQITKTVVELALEVCDAVTKVWDELDMATAMEEAKLITAEVPKASRAARTTEWKDFVYAAANHDLAGAIRQANRKGVVLTRIKLFALAKKLRVCDSVADAIKAVSQKAKANVRNLTPEKKFGMALGIIKNTQTKARKYIAFRKELVALCKKHNVNY